MSFSDAFGTSLGVALCTMRDERPIGRAQMGDVLFAIALTAVLPRAVGDAEAQRIGEIARHYARDLAALLQIRLIEDEPPP